MVWGKLPGYEWWPGVIISYFQDRNGGGGDPASSGEPERSGGLQVWVKWYGENNLSQVSHKTLLFILLFEILLDNADTDREGGAVQ